MASRDKLHRLVDQLPDHDVERAAMMFERMLAGSPGFRSGGPASVERLPFGPYPPPEPFASISRAGGALYSELGDVQTWMLTHWEEDAFIVEIQRKIHGHVVRYEERWTLSSSEPQAIVVDQTFTSARSEYKTAVVLEV